jgi:hypothetical protein
VYVGVYKYIYGYEKTANMHGTRGGEGAKLLPEKYPAEDEPSLHDNTNLHITCGTTAVATPHTHTHKE